MIRRANSFKISLGPSKSLSYRFVKKFQAGEHITINFELQTKEPLKGEISVDVTEMNIIDNGILRIKGYYHKLSSISKKVHFGEIIYNSIERTGELTIFLDYQPTLT